MLVIQNFNANVPNAINNLAMMRGLVVAYDPSNINIFIDYEILANVNMIVLWIVWIINK